MATLSLKKKELERRIAALPAEVEAWRKSTLDVVDRNAHFSQLQAIQILIRTLTDPQPAAVAALDPDQPEAFESAAYDVIRGILKAQRCWDYFRSKLNLRETTAYKALLWTADTIAWDCHFSTMNLAVQFGIQERAKVREPPLVYCTAEYSPATWVRGRRPNDGRVYALGEASLPIPVIELPWDHLTNSWDYLSLHHEVGHDIEADLALRNELQSTLQATLRANGIAESRIAIWLKWQGEVFADLCALRLGGPAFADTLMQLLILPRATVTTYSEDDPHPTAYIRILLNAAYIRKLGATQDMRDHAQRIEREWKAIYGATSGDATLDELGADVDVVCNALMHTNLAALKNRPMADLIPFTEADDIRIRQAANYFRTGNNSPNALRVRFVPGAARLAIQALSDTGALTDAAGAQVHARVLDYVAQNAPPGLRGGGLDAHEKFIASFAQGMFSHET